MKLINISARKYKKIFKIPNSLKVVKTHLYPLFIQTKQKKILGKKVIKKLTLPKGSYPIEIFYRPITNEIHVTYIKKRGK